MFAIAPAFSAPGLLVSLVFFFFFATTTALQRHISNHHNNKSNKVTSLTTARKRQRKTKKKAMKDIIAVFPYFFASFHYHTAEQSRRSINSPFCIADGKGSDCEIPQVLLFRRRRGGRRVLFFLLVIGRRRTKLIILVYSGRQGPFLLSYRHKPRVASDSASPTRIFNHEKQGTKIGAIFVHNTAPTLFPPCPVNGPIYIRAGKPVQRSERSL